MGLDLWCRSFLLGLWLSYHTLAFLCMKKCQAGSLCILECRLKKIDCILRMCLSSRILCRRSFPLYSAYCLRKFPALPGILKCQVCSYCSLYFRLRMLMDCNLCNFRL